MLELRGRNLLKLAYHLKEHRIEYVRQAICDDFAAEKIYVEKLTFEDVTEQVRPRDPIVIEIVGLPSGTGTKIK